MKELLIKKYQHYIDNIAWRIRTDKLDKDELLKLYEKMVPYEAFIEDLKSIIAD